MPLRGVPVVVVGSVYVGGSGKTPLVIWYALEARRLGWRPGVILRGYGGRVGDRPRFVEADDDPAEVGDEAVLIARRTGLPVAVHQDRVAARDCLIDEGCDLIISDDGLQHYALPRQGEVAVLDAAVGLGNGRCLPAGPLREGPQRLREVDCVVGNGGALTGYGGLYFELEPGEPEPVGTVTQSPPPARGARIHAIAAIGRPERFFRMLESMGYRVDGLAFPDHYRLDEREFPVGPVLMTEKDAVKYRDVTRGELWSVPVVAVPDEATAQALRALLDTARRRVEEAGNG